MRNKFFLILILALSFSFSNVSAQDAPKTISGGVLNGKATSLPKPAFPKAAIAVSASGAVTVQVTVDENRKVTSATAVSGHPLLRESCEQAALAAVFAPTILQGQPGRITGVLVYNFVLAMTFTQIGYELSLAKENQSITQAQFDSIRGTMRQDWTEEQNLIKKLNALLTAKSANEKVQANPNTLKTTDAPIEYKGIQVNARTVLGDRDSSVPIASDVKYALDTESTNVIKEFQSKLKSRISVNDNLAWSFRLGTILGELKVKIDDNKNIEASISQIKQLVENKPAGVSESVAVLATELVKAAEQNVSEAEKSKKLLPLVESLRDLRGF